MLFLIGMTIVYFRGDDEFLELTIPLTVFWIFGPFLFYLLGKKPVTSIYLTRNLSQIHIVERSLFKSTTYKIAASEIKALDITEGKDSEGAPYFTCKINVSKNSKKKLLTLIEGHSKETVLATLTQIKNQLGEN